MSSTYWQEGAYGFWHLRLPGNFTGVVGWDSARPKGSTEERSGYKVSFEDVSLVARYKSLDEAKAACERLSSAQLAKAAVALGDERTLALREIANRAGAPDMQYAGSVEKEEQRKSLDWIAARAAKALKGE